MNNFRISRADRRFWIDVIAVLAVLFAVPALATDAATTASEKRSFSTEGFESGEAASGAKTKLVAPASKARTAVSESAGTGFRIFGATADLFFDDDRDGFFYGLDVTFDADTDFFAADVYARLYLSYEGGPWEHYYTTDFFTINGASGLDDYVVRTELFDGYPTGYYDVLIELYDDYDYFVASFGPEDASSLSLLPLEDQQKDAPIVIPASTGVSYSRGGGGALGFGVLIALGAFGFARRRRAAGS